jgi:hypothetical protein
VRSAGTSGFTAPRSSTGACGGLGRALREPAAGSIPLALLLLFQHAVERASSDQSSGTGGRVDVRCRDGWLWKFGSLHPARHHGTQGCARARFPDRRQRRCLVHCEPTMLVVRSHLTALPTRVADSRPPPSVVRTSPVTRRSSSDPEVRQRAERWLQGVARRTSRSRRSWTGSNDPHDERHLTGRAHLRRTAR